MQKKLGRSPKIPSKIIIKEYLEGNKMTDIALRHHVSAETIRLHLAQSGADIYRRYRKLNKEAALKKTEKKFTDIAALLGRIPLKGEVRKYGLSGVNRLFDRFRCVAEKSGYMYIRKKKPAKYSDELLLQHLKTLALKLGHTPCAREIKKDGTYSHITYRLRFGSLCATQKAAGLPPNTRGGTMERAISMGTYVSKEQCLKDLDRITSLLGYFPSVSQIRKIGRYSYDTYKKRLGGVKILRKVWMTREVA